MEDNLYPVSSERLIVPPKKQKEREKKERSKYELERPLLLELKNYLKNRIAHYKSLDAIEPNLSPESTMHQIIANKQTAEILTKELRTIERLEKSYGKDL